MRTTSVLVIWITVFVSAVHGEESSMIPVTISQAVDLALRNFPSIKVSAEQVNAAIAGIQNARTNYLPTVNVLGQVDRATRNNVFGLLLPQSVIPNMSGPVLGTNDGANVWGSAAGLLVSWEPFDFGRRSAVVKSSEAAGKLAEATSERTQFDVAITTAAAFLTLLASEQTVRAGQSAVDRAQVLVRSVNALVMAQLRPGADLSRANAELDAAKIQLIRSQQSVDLARITLAEYTGIDVTKIEALPGSVLRLVPSMTPTSGDLARHPLAREQNAVVEQSKARLKILDQTYRPTFNLQLSVFGRGTGALTNGGTLGSWNGLAPTYFNAGAGLTVNFPVLSLPSIRAQKAQEIATGRSASARYRQAMTQLEAQRSRAEAALTEAQKIAGETPKEVEHARIGFEQANAQYRSGLTTIVTIAEAQRILAQAEIDDSLARLAVWRAVLESQSAEGDIRSFLSEASR